MRKIFLCVGMIFLFISIAWAQRAVGPVKVILPDRMDVSPPLRDMVQPMQKWNPYVQPPREIPNRFDIRKGSQSQGSLDQALQTTKGNKTLGPPLVSFEGVNNVNGVLPPDTNFDVGLTHVMQMVNLSTEIWDKSGNPVLGPFPNNNFWAGFGGPCEFQNAGDPVVLYDQLADRWVVSQFANPVSAAAEQCVAVSTSGDPTGTYRRFSFPTPGNDYPKLGVMEDAYYATVRNFVSLSMDAYAFERAKMISPTGTPQLVVFSMGSLTTRDGFLPSDLDGPTPPPPGTPGIFLGQDDPNDQIVMFELFVDWNNVGNSTLVGPTNFPVAPFDSNIPPGIPQPTTTQHLDDLAFFMMHRLAFRNLGSRQALVATHAVDVNDFVNHAGIRWYELSNPGSTYGSWTINQQGTYSPDSDHRWMPSIAMNGNGDIMVGFSVSSNTTFPSIHYTGRLASDPLNQMTFQEGLVIAGTGAQLHPAGRWGDYSAMTVDPSDDFTFWYTTEYIQTTGSAPWQTRIAAFQPNNLPPLVDITVTPQPGDPVIVPPGGLVFDYDVTVDNNGSTTLNAQIWNTVSLPIGEEVGPFPKATFPQSITVPAGGTFSGTFTLEVPSRVRPNTYTFNMKVGTFPNVQLDRDTFTIIKTPGPATSEVAGGADGWEPVVVASSAKPERFVLDQNYPNPFNPSTVIRYGLPEATHVKLTVYNTLGQRVATLVDGYQSAGFKTVKWDGRDSSGHTVSAGIYVYRLEAGDRVLIKKMAFTK